MQLFLWNRIYLLLSHFIGYKGKTQIQNGQGVSFIQLTFNFSFCTDDDGDYDDDDDEGIKDDNPP